MKIIAVILIHLCFINFLQAGDRGCRIGIVDVSTGTPTKASKRLFELLVMDATQLYTKDKGYTFGWSEDGSKVIPVKATELKGVFTPMIITKDKKSLVKLMEKKELWEGIIVFEYDHKAMKARLKLFDPDGTELGLIKLPLEKSGAMKHSLFKHVRRSSLTALGTYVRFSP